MLRRISNNIRHRWKMMLLLVIVLAGVGIFAIYRSRQEKPQLNFISAERGELTKTLEVSGDVTAKEYAKMRFIGGGKVTYIGAQAGDKVKKWQTIATIDQRSLQKSLQKDLNDYMQQRLDWDQTLDNTKDRTIPKTEERTKSQEQLTLDNSVIDVEISNIAITNTVLSAPFDGVLINSPTNIPGVVVSATETFDVINPDSLIFRALVDEVDIAQVQIGQKAVISLDAYPDEKFETTVNYISYQSVESSTGTVFQIDMKLTGEKSVEKFRLGMNGDATITLDTRTNTLSVPLDATFERDDKTFVTLKTGEDTTEEREIQTGIETDDRIEVISGLTESDQIVLPE